ncbi:hypothetical protein SRHO_G00239670 [Serrasalmus rhombeus]
MEPNACITYDVETDVNRRKGEGSKEEVGSGSSEEPNPRAFRARAGVARLRSRILQPGRTRVCLNGYCPALKNKPHSRKRETEEKRRAREWEGEMKDG